MPENHRTLRCVVLGCTYDDTDHCARCGRENPRYATAKRTLSGRYD